MTTDAGIRSVLTEVLEFNCTMFTCCIHNQNSAAVGDRDSVPVQIGIRTLF